MLNEPGDEEGKLFFNFVKALLDQGFLRTIIVSYYRGGELDFWHHFLRRVVRGD